MFVLQYMLLNTFRVYCAVWTLALASSLAYSEFFYGVSLYVKDNSDIRVAMRSRSRGFDGFLGCFAADPALSLVKSYRVGVGVVFSVYPSMSGSKKNTLPTHQPHQPTQSMTGLNPWFI